MICQLNQINMEEIKKDRQKIWFVSDTHFGHVSVLYFHPLRREACGVTLEELQSDKNSAIAKHDQWLINKWNETVRKQDTVYFLGDFCLKNKEYTENILRQLKGKKFLIRGNHDKSLNGLENYFEWVGDIKEAKFTNNQFKFIDPNETFCVEMCHFPMLTWNRRPHGTCMVHGHSHGNANIINELTDELRVDVGLDNQYWDYNFVELEQLYNYFRNIIKSHGFSTFQDYVNYLMETQGYRI